MRASSIPILCSLTLVSGLILLFSRDFVALLPVFLCLFALLIWIILSSRSLPGLLLISALSSLTLTLRFPYLPWGDPWQDYAMVIRTLTLGHLDFTIIHEPVLQSLISQPLMPELLAWITRMTHGDPMLMQQIIIPLCGATSPLILYYIGKEFITKDEAFLGAVLYLVCTPFLHWLTQPVRETLGLPVLFLALWLWYRVIFSGRHQLIAPAFICTITLPLLHTLSALIFLISWWALSLALLIGIEVRGGSNDIWKKLLPSWAVFVGSFLFTTFWGLLFNPHFMRMMGDQISDFVPGLNLPEASLLILLAFSISLPYPFLLTKKVHNLIQNSVDKISHFPLDRIVLIIQIGGICTFISGLLFISGLFHVKISYPIPMLLPSLILFLIALSGLGSILLGRKFPVFFWMSTLTVYFIIGILKPSLVEDPLRTLGYLCAPLCLIAGIGSARLYEKPTRISGTTLVTLGLTIFCTISLVLTFPALVFLGIIVPPGHLLYDERQYTINHPESEIEGIRWLAENHKNGTIYTDTNIYYATLWMTQDGTIRSEKHPDRLSPDQFKPDEYSYTLISERMFTTAKFGEWIWGEARPLSVDEYQKVVNTSEQIYAKDGFWIFNHQPREQKL
ncbi:MAG TPA: glycosyltransferase family 39 protein [Methanospirillum sp.]|nr:glycosyltransferase family 39 protein [Methanospirillum sp.]